MANTYIPSPSAKRTNAEWLDYRQKQMVSILARHALEVDDCQALINAAQAAVDADSVV